jgi:hypothetical protein
LILGQLSVLPFQGLLDLYGAFYGIHDTCKFSEDVVARRIHYSPPVLTNKLRNRCPMLLQGFDCGLFVLTHETAVTLDICTEDGSELTFGYLGGHEILLT